MIFFKIVNFFNFLHIVYDNRLFSVQKSLRAIAFGSDTPLKVRNRLQMLGFSSNNVHYG